MSQIELRPLPAVDPLLSISAPSDPLRQLDPLRPSDPLRDLDEGPKARAPPTSSFNGGQGAAQYEAASREWDQSKTALMHQFASSGTISVSAVRGAELFTGAAGQRFIQGKRVHMPDAI